MRLSHLQLPSLETAEGGDEDAILQVTDGLLSQGDALNSEILRKLAGSYTIPAQGCKGLMTAKNIDDHELGQLVAEAYSQGKDKAFDELLYVLADPHALGCGCRPCVVIEAVRAAAGLRQEQRDELVQQAFRLIG